MRRVLRTCLIAVAVLPLLSCRSEPKETLLDREYALYQAEREETRLEDLKTRRAKAQAEADRLSKELAGLEADAKAKRQRVREAAAAGLRLPDAMRLSDAPSPPAGGAGAGVAPAAAGPAAGTGAAK